MMHNVYLLFSDKDDKFYTGSRNDLKRRFKEHNLGNVKSTKNRRPLQFIYYEGCINEKDAQQREKYLKSGIRKRYLKNRLKHYLENLLQKYQI